MVQAFVLYCGGSIGYFSGDNNKLVDDIVALKPTLFCSVPALLEKLVSRCVDG